MLNHVGSGNWARSAVLRFANIASESSDEAVAWTTPAVTATRPATELSFMAFELVIDALLQSRKSPQAMAVSG